MSPLVRLSIFHQFDIFGTKVGGIETFIKGFVKFAPDDFEIELVGLSEDPEERRIGVRAETEFEGRAVFNRPVLFAPRLNFPSRIPLSLKYTWALWRGRVPVAGRILDFHRMEPPLAFARRKTPKVYVCHHNLADLADPLADIKWKHLPWAYFQMEKRLIRGMSLIYGVNQSGLDFYKERYPDLVERMHYTPTWVDDTVFRPLRPGEREEETGILRQELDLDRGGALILFAGRLNPQKDPFLLLESFRELKKSRPQDKLVLAGEGEARARLEEMVREFGLEDSVRFTGKLAQPRLARLMRGCDLVTLTSSFEGMPMCIMEGLGSGVPAVSTKVTGVDKVLKEDFSGIIVAERKPGPLARAMAMVLDNPDRYGPDNCLAAVEKYKAGRVLAPIYEAHHELAAQKP